MIADMAKVRRIADELLHQAMLRGAGKVTLEILDLPEETVVVTEDDGQPLVQAEQERLLADLSAGRRDELDTYYGVLLGEQYVDNSLAMLGMMIDRAELETTTGSNRLTVHRLKSGDKR